MSSKGNSVKMKQLNTQCADLGYCLEYLSRIEPSTFKTLYIFIFVLWKDWRKYIHINCMHCEKNLFICLVIFLIYYIGMLSYQFWGSKLCWYFQTLRTIFNLFFPLWVMDASRRLPLYLDTVFLTLKVFHLSSLTWSHEGDVFLWLIFKCL